MTIRTDFLVIGTGIAGLSFAIKAASLGEVIVLAKREAADTNTAWAQGGVATVVADDDDIELHVIDTLNAGAGLCHEDIVRLTVSSAPDRMQELIAWGVRFTRAHNGRGTHGGFGEDQYDLHLEGGHTRRRVLHAGDITGEEIQRALLARARNEPNIRIVEHHMAIDLLTRRKHLGGSGPDRCHGAYVLNVPTGEVETILARHTALATGGSGKVYLLTTNPDVATGDGVAMAARAGAEIANMEFVQFHPTVLFHPHAKNFLISEAVRGAGAVLVNEEGEEFVKRHDPRGSLAPRDIVARAIDHEIKSSGRHNVFLDFTRVAADTIRAEFPNIHARCLALGIDITRDRIPVAPAAHYQCGGVRTDDMAQTSIPGLSAIGECACTGLHGANRLASNSLLEGAVFAHQAAEYARAHQHEWPAPPDAPAWDIGGATPSDEEVIVTQNWDEIRRFMQNYVGIVRTDRRLERAKARIDLLRREISEYYWNFLVTRDLLELRNIAVVADLIIVSAMQRKESRGLHDNLDWPDTNPARPAADTVLRYRW
ncbi:L-aspartate oxidase [bacterium]|nr:L-aspartate oxidase [bacterium]